MFDTVKLMLNKQCSVMLAQIFKEFTTMKKLALLLLTIILSPLASATEFSEGTHYKVISKAAVPAQLEITEYFSFLCGHCFKFEPLVKDLKSKLPVNIKFNKSHVEFLGGPLGQDLSRAYAVASLLNVEDTINPIIFNAVHIERQQFSGLQDIRQIFIDNGVEANKFDSAARSFIANGRVSKMAHNAQKLSINAVPTFIVISSSENFQELVKYLANKK